MPGNDSDSKHNINALIITTSKVLSKCRQFTKTRYTYGPYIYMKRFSMSHNKINAN